MKVDKPNLIKTDPNQALKDKLKGAAELYEKQFLREMVRAMRRSVDHSSMTKPGMAENIYRDQLDEEYVESWVDRGGTGFADMVYNELVDKYFPHLQKQKPREGLRPANITDRYQGITKKPGMGQAKESSQFVLQLKPQRQESPLNVPWQAELKKAFTLPSGEQVVQMEHPEGLNSTFVFKGGFQKELLGQKLQSGQNFAYLSPEAQQVTWQVDGGNSQKGPSE